MKIKLFAVWTNEYSARFNAVLGLQFVLLALFVMMLFDPALAGLTVVIVGLWNTVELIAAWYAWRRHVYLPSMVDSHSSQRS